MTEAELLLAWREALVEAREALLRADAMNAADLIPAWGEALNDAEQALERVAAAHRTLSQHYPAGIAADPRLDPAPDKAAGERHGSD